MSVLGWELALVCSLDLLWEAVPASARARVRVVGERAARVWCVLGWLVVRTRGAGARRAVRGLGRVYGECGCVVAFVVCGVVRPCRKCVCGRWRLGWGAWCGVAVGRVGASRLRVGGGVLLVRAWACLRRWGEQGRVGGRGAVWAWRVCGRV